MSDINYRDLCIVNNSKAAIDGIGRNIIPPAEKDPLWKQFIEKFKDPIIIVLLVVFAFSVIVSIYEIFYSGKSLSTLIEPLGILSALLLATGVGFIFEVRADKEFEILNKKKDERPVKVLRWKNTYKTGRPQMQLIKKSDVIVGDIVRLESGDEVPADGRIIKSSSLMVDESNFTGEMYASKMADISLSRNDAAYPCNFLLRGSTIIEGNCLYQVTATGIETEEGHGAMILREESDVKTPLNSQLDTLGEWITKASYVFAILIIVGRLAFYLITNGIVGLDWIDLLEFTLNSIMIAVTLIVVAVPEGLPMSVTISLALSMKRMLKENNLVRKLHACETMGAATVICTDKTGTLTQNKLRVMEDSEEVFVDMELFAQCIAVNSTAELEIKEDGSPQSIGNPTEGSILFWLNQKGFDYQSIRDNYTIISQESFSPEAKRMSTTATDKHTKKTYRYIKGAPEIILNLCDEIAGGWSKDCVLERLSQMQSIGRRTLAMAYQEIIEGSDTPVVFAGFLGMTDPIREDVPTAIADCHTAGVRVIMVTGDVSLTANQIARETGIMTEDEPLQELTGAQFAELSDNEIKTNVLPSLKVLSRARPADKARLVTLLQETGEVVAVTGDGTNDAPALKKAQVGLSMGDGTARAKEASDITIIDNSFASINTAILWGRSLYLNIKRFIVFQMTINVCACLVVLIGAFIGLDSPLTVTQMLWVNLIMDTFAAMALSSLPPDKRVMKDKPRSRNAKIIDRTMAVRILSVGLFFFVFLFGLWQLMWHQEITSVADLLKPETWSVYFRNFFDLNKTKPHLDTYELGIFFTFFVLLQFWNLFNARYFKTGRSLVLDILDSVTHPKNAKNHFSLGFILIGFVILTGQYIIVNWCGGMFNVSSLSADDWKWLLVLTSPILVISELVRGIKTLLNEKLHD